MPKITSTSITHRGILFLIAYRHCLSRRHDFVCTMKCHIDNTAQRRLHASQYPCNTPKKLILNRSMPKQYTLHNHIEVNLQCESER